MGKISSSVGDGDESAAPLNGLRAFEAAARHLSFKKAAEELHVTPAAISQQVRALEDYVGRPLFRRLTRALALTDAGAAAAPLLKEGFDRLAPTAAAICRERGAVVLTVSVAPGTVRGKLSIHRIAFSCSIRPEKML